ncbi:MAG: alcohol dehydrogenase [Synergistaceae bacterium]|jgi:ribosomal protein S27AE|nr:alcohol dehydrogenase [Synergistaceae bacterium]
MLIVGCQNCGESKVLADAPDSDGVARVKWTCPHCGTGQVLQLDVSEEVLGGGARRALSSFALMEFDEDDGTGKAFSGANGPLGFFGGAPF